MRISWVGRSGPAWLCHKGCQGCAWRRQDERSHVTLGVAFRPRYSGAEAYVGFQDSPDPRERPLQGVPMILRDPIHGLVAFESEEDAIVTRLLGTGEVQRLRRIRQLGLTSFAFPG